mmetsp:Transcript_11756/g.20192  ORF Transcript_11756/g.20192 Transcript_11756/m.20192 type:complete len:231 (+) Transcript_11756:43-735(+)|eukprot:CAMPEP_0184692782 /NCGR_PEP_ID=MMETSP0313-20130426/1110_1 /TAXON_ID=2792 /ORGANISM="Porphyridium aerugineum, Strain SAG 1380-2" /LENGTH=230 /DNA_ID=CAMNT_0027150631 /DNA_START=43 /DNA_END=735 /DNA_ORIENTATION=+
MECFVPGVPGTAFTAPIATISAAITRAPLTPFNHAKSQRVTSSVVMMAGFGKKDAGASSSSGAASANKKKKKTLIAEYLDLMELEEVTEAAVFVRPKDRAKDWCKVGMICAENQQFNLAVAKFKRAILEHGKVLSPLLLASKEYTIGYRVVPLDEVEDSEAISFDNIVETTKEDPNSAELRCAFMEEPSRQAPYYKPTMPDGRAAPVDLKSQASGPRKRGQGKSPDGGGE